MADEKELDFMGMLQSDPEYLQLQQKKALAQALQAAVMKAQGGNYRKHPLAVGLDMMTMRGQKDQMKNVTAQEAALFKQHKAAEQGGIEEITAALSGGQGGQGANPEAAIYKHLASQYPNLRKMAEAANKDRTGVYNQTLSSFGDRLDPASALSGTRDIRGLRVAPPMAPPTLKQQDGVKWIESYNRKGEPHVNTVPVPTIGNLNLGEKKLGWDTVEAQAKEMISGKTADKGNQIQGQIQTTTDLLNTLNTNPQMGAGASGMQEARKWLDFVTGKPQELTGNTEQMKSQLGLSVLSYLGSLGVGISNDDRKMIQEAVGSLDTDPRALRRLLLVQLKSQMQAISRHYEQAKRIEQHPGLAEQGVNLKAPYQFNSTLATDDANDLESVMMGRMPALRPGTPQPRSRIAPRTP